MTVPQRERVRAPIAAANADEAAAASLSAMQNRPVVCFVWTSTGIRDLLLGDNTQHAGGAQVQLATIGRELAARGWNPCYVVRSEGQPREVLLPDGLRVIPSFRRREGKPVGGLLLRKLPQLWGALGRADADVYVVRGKSWLCGAVALYARARGRKAVYWAASTADVLPDRPGLGRGLAPARILARYGVFRSHLVVVQTRTQALRARRRLRRHSELIRNVCPVEAAVRIGGDGGGVLWVGEMRPIKRPWLCLDVARLLPHVRFTMVGGPDVSKPRLFTRVQAAAGRLPNVRFLGHVPFGEVGKHYDHASLLLCTSDSEGFPNIFLQAWARGLPVASTVDPDEVICRHGLGYHGTAPGDLAAQVGRLLSRPVVRDAIRVRAQRYVSALHAPPAVVPVLERVLLGLVAGRDEAARACQCCETADGRQRVTGRQRP